MKRLLASKSLDLRQRMLTDVSRLAAFAGLKSLNLAKNPVSDLSSLAGCKK